MAEKTQASQTLGLELTSSQLKAAELCFKHRKPQIIKLFDFNFQRHNDEPSTLASQDRALLDLSGNILVATSIDGNETLVRPLDIKLKKEKDIDAVLQFQAEPLLPYPPEDAILDKIVLSKMNDGGSQLSLLAVKREHLKNHLEGWKQLAIEPEVVSATPAALAAFSEFVLPPETLGHFVLHLGEDQTCCIFVKEGKLIASKPSHYTIATLKQAFQQDLKLISSDELSNAFDSFNWKEIDSTKYPATSQQLKDFSIDIGKVIFSLMKQTKELELPSLLTTGEGSNNESLCSLLIKEFNGPLIDFPSNISPLFPEAEIKKHAISIGAALTALPSAQWQVNFLQGEFSYPHPWKRLKQPLFIYYLLCTGLAIAFYLFGQAYLTSKDVDLRSNYAELLKTMHKSYSGVEEDLATKQALIDENIHAGAPLDKLSQDDINFRLERLESELRAVPDLFPLEPNVPKVSDLLAWLSTHPKVSSGEAKHPLITFESISYTMVKHPEHTKKSEKYQVKVELDFTSVNPTAAREFHDALLASQEFLDPKTVKWSTQKDHYKAVFLLKDKTNYP